MFFVLSYFWSVSDSYRGLGVTSYTSHHVAQLLGWNMTKCSPGTLNLITRVFAASDSWLWSSSRCYQELSSHYHATLEYTSTFGAADTHCSAAGWIQHLLQEPLCSENILNTVAAGHHLSHSHKWLLPDQKQKPSSRWQWLMTRPGTTCIRVNSLILDFLRVSHSMAYGTQEEHKVCFITEQSQCYNVPSSAE